MVAAAGTVRLLQNICRISQSAIPARGRNPSRVVFYLRFANYSDTSCASLRLRRAPHPAFGTPLPNGTDRVPYLFRWTQGVTETRTESGLSALKGRGTVAQGKRAVRAPPWVRGASQISPSPLRILRVFRNPLPARGRGVGEWGLNKWSRTRLGHPLCPAHRLVGQDQFVGRGWPKVGEGSRANGVVPPRRSEVARNL